MKALRCLQAMFLVSQLTPFAEAHSNTICQNFKFVIDEDVVYNHVLKGHVFRRLTVHSPAQCHIMCKDDCLCTSMNYISVFKENNCELNAVNKEMDPTSLKWKHGVNYYHLVRSYIVKVSCHRLSVCQLVHKSLFLFICFCLFVHPFFFFFLLLIR